LSTAESGSAYAGCADPFMSSCPCYKRVDLVLRPDLSCFCVGRGTAEDHFIGTVANETGGGGLVQQPDSQPDPGVVTAENLTGSLSLDLVCGNKSIAAGQDEATVFGSSIVIDVVIADS
jgi:hypothetical protein